MTTAHSQLLDATEHFAANLQTLEDMRAAGASPDLLARAGAKVDTCEVLVRLVMEKFLKSQGATGQPLTPAKPAILN